MRIPEEYRLLHREHIAEADSEAWVLEHGRTGAGVIVLENDDENKVFSIGFRTPPADSTGVAHILEHSVLCGSKRFPLRDPFMELAKSSLQTFLNAMTFSDKTVYPVASLNDQDFQNLMEVYLDAVFAPKIGEQPEIFWQEGWHYETGEEGRLAVNGVVYNEMKGAFSSPDDLLVRSTESALYPDTAYANESGGDPEVIPTLTWEAFCSFHRRYYHPSNSYIDLYGNADMEEKLRYIDREYLSHYDRLEIDSWPGEQKPFAHQTDRTMDYPLDAGEEETGRTWLSVSWSVGRITDPLLCLAFEVLDHVLLSSSGAILKKALQEAGIGEDIFGGYYNEIFQPYFSVVAKDTDPERQEEFLCVIRETLGRLAEEGIDSKYLLAGISSIQFRRREADYGPYPKGLVYGLQILDSWLYDRSDPLMHLRHEAIFSELRRRQKEGYFEELIRTWFLDNPHAVRLMMHPVPGLVEKKEEELAAKTDAYAAALTPDEREEIRDRERRLALYQGTASTQEEMDSLPVLCLKDIDKKVKTLSTKTAEAGGRPVYLHEHFCGGIAYITLLFDLKGFTGNELPMLALLRSVSCLMDTAQRGYADLANEISLYTGGMGNAVNAYEDASCPESFLPCFEFSVKVLEENVPEAYRLLREILLETDYSDARHLRELILEIRSRTEMSLTEAGHLTAASRALAHISPINRFQQKLSGLDQFRCLEALSRSDEIESGRLSASLKALAEALFTKARLSIDITCDARAVPGILAETEGFLSALPEGVPSEHAGWSDSSGHMTGREGFTTPGQVVYVAQAGRYDEAGESYTGAMKVLQRILSNDYLWHHLREQGGAYGCMCDFGRFGRGYLVSYRDPHFARTLDVYEKIPEYLRGLTLDRKTMEKFIISTIGGLDRPLTPSAWGAASAKAFLCGITEEMRQQERDQILSCTVEDLRRLAPAVQAVLDSRSVCVVGNSATIRRDGDMLDSLETLSGREEEGDCD